MPDRADVAVRLRPLELHFRHRELILVLEFAACYRVTSSVICLGPCPAGSGLRRHRGG
jgi:hypothetical protein